MHLDMDAFFASIEQQSNPALRGKPVIIGGRNNKYRSIVCAASYEAKRLGIDSAMPSWKALKICPEALFVPADTSKYVDTSREIQQILEDFSPQVERFAIDEFFLDVGGCEKLYGSAEKIAEEIKQRIKERFGITCSIGVAPSRLTSKLAAKLKKPDGLVVWRSFAEVKDGVRRLPIEKICGIGSRLKRRFNLLGVFNCEQLSHFPDAVLKQHFGVVGLWLKAVALGQDAGGVGFTVEGEAPPQSVGHSQTLREVTSDQVYIHEWIYLLSEMVGERLRRKRLQGRTVHFYFSDGFEGGWGKQKTFNEPTYDGREICRRCCTIIQLLKIKALTVRMLAVSVTGLVPAQDAYLFDNDQRRVRLLESMDAINHRFGEWTVFPASVGHRFQVI